MNTPTRRFEFTQGTSNKFWEVWCVDQIMFCRWGRIGGRAQKKTWWYGSVAAARSMASRKANQKIGKGYVEVVDQVRRTSAGVFVNATSTATDTVSTPKAKKKAKRLTAKGRANRDALRQRQADEAKFKRRGPRIG